MRTTSTYYQSVKPVQKEVTNKDIAAAITKLLVLFVVCTLIFTDVLGKLLELIK